MDHIDSIDIARLVRQMKVLTTTNLLQMRVINQEQALKCKSYREFLMQEYGISANDLKKDLEEKSEPERGKVFAKVKRNDGQK